MKRIIVALLSLTFAVAATPSEVAPVIAEQGYYIEDGSDATPEVIGGAVTDARNAGGDLSVIALAEDPPQGCATFAESTLERTPSGEGTVLCLSPGLVGWAKNNSYWTTTELNDALEVSLDGETSDDSAVLFVDSLLGVDEGGGGSGLMIFLVFILVVGGGIAFLIWRGNRSAKRRAADALSEMKDETQKRIDALANDILDDEDEVSESGNAEAADRFDKATAIYAEASDRLGRATTPQQVVDIAGDVDEAIWHLDCAEAILDGTPLPDRPARPERSEPASAPAPMHRGPFTANAPPTSSTTTGVPPLEPYQRRRTRRSSYGADDMVTAMLAMQAMRSLGGRGRGRSSGRSSSSRSSSGSRSPGRARGGGKKRR